MNDLFMCIWSLRAGEARRRIIASNVERLEASGEELDYLAQLGIIGSWERAEG